MELAPQLFTAKVMHKRLFPKENSFTYGVYYLALPLPAAPVPGLLAHFCPEDVGFRDGTDPYSWARSILMEYGLTLLIKHITLITMPRVMGYIFNPVSFYLCMDEQKQLRAVICEVHNTFGEQHSYVCAHPDFAPLHSGDWLEAEKLFHVSPFLERNGHYRFRFSLKGDKLGIWIDYYDAASKKQLLTALTGELSPLTAASLRKAFWEHKLLTLRAITLIHWQALKLLYKRVRYIKKPTPLPDRVSTTRNLTRK